MANPTINVLVINNRDKIFEYSASSPDDVGAVNTALENYVTKVIGSSNLNTSLDFWKDHRFKISTGSEGLKLQVEFINGLCKKNAHKIKNVLCSYTKIYP